MAYPMNPVYCRRCRNLLGECEVTIICEECGAETECLLKGGVARPLPRECMDEIKG